jgi:ABC-type glycerol-3-phosphate transport system permease component
LVSTAIVVAVVAVLMLLGIGMVVNQLFRLKKWLNAAPPVTPVPQPPDDEVRRTPEPPV